MKRKKIIIFVAVFLFAMIVLHMPVFAAEGDAADNPSVPTSTEETEGTTNPVGTEEEAEAFYSGWIDKITNSTLWISIGSYVLAALGVLALVRNKFGVIIEMVRSKADGAVIREAIKSAGTEISTAFKNELDAVNKKLDESEDNEKKLMTILTLFVTNAKMNPNAKAEIMKYLSGVKEYAGTVEEIVENATRAIEAADAAEEKAPTPALDRLREDQGKEEITMTLG